MSRGLYALTSGMLTQQRKIEISSNNVANINTAGYKKEQAVTSNFGSLFIHKYKQKGLIEEKTPLDNVSIIRTVVENNTIHSQGVLEETDNIMDFAIRGQGFFSVDNGTDILYTRNGSFHMDDEGYLALTGGGRVQGEFGEIYLGTDKFDFSSDGTIYVEGEPIDKIAVYDFLDYNNLNKFGEGLFTSGEEPDLSENATILNKTIERSNVNITEELTDIISSQRSLQTAAQALKIYDMVNEKSVSEIGKLP